MLYVGTKDEPRPISIKVCQYMTNMDGAQLCCVSWFEPTEVRRLGRLPGEAVIAVMIDPNGEVSPSNMRGNKLYRLFMHDAVEQITPSNAVAIEVARHLQNGLLAVPDARGSVLWELLLETKAKKDDVTLPPEVIVGWFEVVDGGIIKASYRKNEAYNPLSTFIGSVLPAFRADMLRLIELRAQGGQAAGDEISTAPQKRSWWKLWGK